MNDKKKKTIFIYYIYALNNGCTFRFIFIFRCSSNLLLSRRKTRLNRPWICMIDIWYECSTHSKKMENYDSDKRLPIIIRYKQTKKLFHGNRRHSFSHIMILQVYRLIVSLWFDCDCIWLCISIPFNVSYNSKMRLSRLSNCLISCKYHRHLSEMAMKHVKSIQFHNELFWKSVFFYLCPILLSK